MAKKFTRQAPAPAQPEKRGPGRPPKNGQAAPAKMSSAAPKPQARKVKDEKVRVVTPVGMISYPHLAAPDSGRINSDDRFKLDLIWDRKTWKSPEAEKMRRTVLEVARRYFGNPDLTFGEFKSPFRQGSERNSPEYADCVFITAKTTYKPTILGPNKAQWDEERVQKIKGGDFARITAIVHGYEHKAGGITLILDVLQFAREGDALGSGRKASIEMLDELEEELEDIDEDEDVDDDDEPEADDDTEDDEEEDEPPRKKKKPVKKEKPQKQAKRRARAEEEDDEEDEEDYDEDEPDEDFEEDDMQI